MLRQFKELSTTSTAHLGDMTTGCRNPPVRLIGSKPERIVQTSRTVIADCTQINESDFPAPFARIIHADDLRQNIFDVLPKQAVDDHVEEEPLNEGIDEEESMSGDESNYGPGYSRLTHDDECGLICKALQEHDERRL